MSRFSELINSNKPTLVDFTATWCGSSKMMKAMLEELKTRLGDKATIIKVDIDQSPEAAWAYKIQSIPILLLFRKGKIIWRQSGVVAAHQLEQLICQHSI